MSKKPVALAKRDNWGTRIGFLMTTWFAAIGIGNMWRFPFRCAGNGGGAFLLPYLVFILLISLPSVILESASGKYGHSSTVDTMGKMSGLRGIGVMMLLLNMFAAYYIVVVSQSLYWVIESARNVFAAVSPEEVWRTYQGNKALCFGMFAITLILSAIPPFFGIQKGIERVAKWIGGFAFVIILVGAVRGVLLPGAIDGLVYYLTPDWSNMFTASTLTSALSQAYFTFGAGWGWFLVLSSYLKKESDAGYGNLTTCFADTSFALLAGFAIIPTLFACGYTSETVKTLGASTAYVAMPQVFMGMKGGYIISLLFFLALFVAAYSCAYVLIEVIACFMVDTLHMSRKKGTVVSALLLLVCGAAPSVSESLLNNLDNVFGSYVLPTLVTLLVVAVGYRFGGERLRIMVINTFGNGYIGRWVTVLIKYLVPAVNIFLMVWFAHSNQASGIWFLGYGGLGLTWLITVTVVAGLWWYDKKHNYQWDGTLTSKEAS